MNRKSILILFLVFSVLLSLSQTLDVSITYTEVHCNKYPDGTATANVSGGTSPYAYLWSNGSTTQTILGLDTIEVSLTITDALQVNKPSSVRITSNYYNDLVVTNVYDTLYGCDHEEEIVCATGHGGTADTTDYWFQWSVGLGNSSVKTSCCYLYFIDSITNYYVVLEDGCMISDTAFYTLIKYPEDSPDCLSGLIQTEIPSIKVYYSSNNDLVIERNSNGDLSILLYDVTGKQVFNRLLTESYSRLNMNINTGAYFYRIAEDDMIICSGKLFFE